MTMRTLSIGLGLAFALSACARAEKPSSATDSAPPPAANRAQGAALIANAIAANPTAADSILKANGQTADGFQKLMYEIAADSAMSAEYARAKSR
jgi:hypothetical protein